LKNLIQAFQDAKPEEVVPKAKSIPKEHDLEKALVKAIDDAIAEDINPRFVKWGGFHPSNTNECPRYMVYLFRGVEQQQDHDSRVQRIFDNGHAMHERYGEYFKRMGILLEQELPVWHDDPPIEGTCDGILDWDGHTLLELKSISEAGFTYRRLYHRPKEDHFRQAQLYMYALGLTKAFVVYENKNNQEILAFLVERDEEFIEKLLKKYRKIYKAYKDDILPARPYKREGEKCQSCQLKDLCRNDTDEGQKI